MLKSHLWFTYALTCLKLLYIALSKEYLQYYIFFGNHIEIGVFILRQSMRR